MKIVTFSVVHVFNLVFIHNSSNIIVGLHLHAISDIPLNFNGKRNCEVMPFICMTGKETVNLKTPPVPGRKKKLVVRGAS